MYLNPVSVSTQRSPSRVAIAFCRSVVTNVLTITPRLRFSALRIPCRRSVVARYHAISEPIWLPVSSRIAPAASRTATPIRSQSGSVATTRSACCSRASAIASVSASAFSGFGLFTVGKRPSNAACSATSENWNPSRVRIGRIISPPVPWIGVKTIRRSRPASTTERSSTSVWRRSRYGSSISASTTRIAPRRASGSGV